MASPDEGADERLRRSRREPGEVDPADTRTHRTPVRLALEERRPSRHDEQSSTTRRPTADRVEEREGVTARPVGILDDP